MKMKEKLKQFFCPDRKAVKGLLIFFTVVLGLVALDFLSKWLVQTYCTPHSGIEVIPNFFYIYLTYNTGIAFGLFDGMAGRVVNILVSIVLSIGIALYLVHAFHRLKRFERLTGLLLLSGAIGNMIDRVFYWKATVGFDGVIDFFQFYLGGGPGKESTFLNPFATFNQADAYLTVGIVFLVVIVVIDLIKGEVRKGKELEKKQAEASQSEKEMIISSVERQDAAEKSQNKEGETDGQ